MNQAERKFALSIFVQGGHGPFRGLDAPFSAESQRNSESQLKSITVRTHVIQTAAAYCYTAITKDTNLWPI